MKPWNFGQPGAGDRLYDSVPRHGRRHAVHPGETPQGSRPGNVTVYVKFEAFNPAGSVKDRLALNIIEAAERDGRSSPEDGWSRPTSGNTGTGSPWYCAAKAYPLVSRWPTAFLGPRRRRLMRFPRQRRSCWTPRRQAQGLRNVQQGQWSWPGEGWSSRGQFDTRTTPIFHEATTAREILGDFEGRRLDYWINRVWHRRHGPRGSEAGAAQDAAARRRSS